MKRKLINTMKQEQIKLIKNLSMNKETLKNTAYFLGWSIRHTRRKLNDYKKNGARAFVHGNTYKIPPNKITQLMKDEIISQYQLKYFDYNMLHYWEIVWKEKLSYASLRNIFIENKLEVKTMTRKTKREIKKANKLSAPHPTAFNNFSHLIITKYPDPTKGKKLKFGEVFKADASNHEWILGKKCHLHIVIDKASKRVLSGYFSEQETTESYYIIYEEAFEKYGLLEWNITDNRNIFSSKNNRDYTGTDNLRTQLQYIFHSLGIKTKTTSIPQEKALVERTFGTMQGRWPQKIRLMGLKTIEELNSILPILIEEYNSKCSVMLDQLENVTREYKFESNIVFSYRNDRKVDSGHCINYKKEKWYLCFGFEPVFFKSGLDVMITETKDGQIFGFIGNDIYNLIRINDDRLHGNTKSLPNEEFEKIKLPKIDTPWRASNWYFF